MAGTYAGAFTYQTFKELVQTPAQKLLNALIEAKQAYDESTRVTSVFGATGALMAAKLPDVPEIVGADAVVLKTKEDVMNDILAAKNDFNNLFGYVSTGSNILTHLQTLAQFGK